MLKSSWADFCPFVANGVVDQLLPNAHYVLLERVDKVAQAVSLFKAKETGIWHSTGPKEASPEASFDLVGLARAYESIVAESNSWKDYLLASDSPRLHLTYEGFRDDMSSAVAHVCSFIGRADLKLVAGEAKSKYHKLSDAKSQIWATAFREYLRGDPTKVGALTE